MVVIDIKQDQFWNKFEKDEMSIYLKGHIYSHSINELIELLYGIEDESSIAELSHSIDGHFAIAVQKNDLSFILVDKIRSTPLFFYKFDKNFYISNNPQNIINQNDSKVGVDTTVLLEASMSGYTIGNKTFYKGLYALKAGELVVFKDDNFKYIQYYKYFGEIEKKDYKTYQEESFDVTLKIFRKMLKNIGNRQIVVPLSAGNDSRLVVSALKYLSAKNVKCFSYGTQDNSEAKVAKIVAEKLGYEWIFIPLTHCTEKHYYSSNDYAEYLKYSESFASVPYIQGLSALKYLKDIGYVDSDAIFINGNSGDFISGAHISKMMESGKNLTSYEDRKENILNNLINKHFSLWGYLKTEKNISLIKKKLWDEIVLACGDLRSDSSQDHLFYEYSEFIDRQTKYVISGQRIYEYYGHEWRMPLWDDEYLFFWQKVPAEFKDEQNLYVSMLKDKNMCNVWGNDIPVNKKSIVPSWIIPLRFIFKIPFVFFGKNAKKYWRNFEISFFYYWMDVTHMMDTVKYTRAMKDIFKKPRSHVSWQTEDYLSRFRK